MPSLLRRNAGNCRSHALLGNGGTIIYKKELIKKNLVKTKNKSIFYFTISFKFFM